MLNAYLRDLEREMARNVTPEDLRARLAEAEDHLREDVDARVELGMTLDQAEREAIEAFGPPMALAKAESPSVRPRLALVLAGYGAGLVTFFVGSWMIRPGIVPLIVGLLLVWSALAIAFAVQAFRARRPRPLAIFAVGCAASFAVTLVIGTTTVFRTGAGVLPKWRVAADRASLLDGLNGRLGEGVLLRREIKRLDGPKGIESFRGPRGYRVPIPASASRWDARLVERNVARADGARDDVRGAWRENVAEVRRLRDDLDELEEGMAHPVRNLIQIGPEVVTLNVVAAVWIALTDLVFGGMGALIFRLRRRRIPVA